MPIASERKLEIIKKFSNKEGDTGSIQVQCALCSERINVLTEHLKLNKKDFSSKRGLLMIVAARRKLLKYLQRTSMNQYRDLITKLGIRK
ncbi:30S ribosomal protein S15 [Rickettsia endosymbiont of Cardiosporidium cionae]|uniref:30S ribosomal protein S15 n=1 Tax=Rickettsia endosymbiont of Cardiosporidium cionae TaxID=2777155 RepID=UPI0018944CAA|nr:30S ribosomal protein S15 [Rickettsia endosymbiont of Cardiosporidium cionae]KAF8818473.1 30S ribosomal protein S15 [Rickettsia endosymbiont of Cardiosporidium cionae]